jgi:colanic acid/amylovoran biosynthesis glycosyltransferase
MTSTKPSIAFVHNIFLSYTETFLYQQLTRLERHNPVVFTRRIDNQDRFPWSGPVYMPSEPKGLCAPVQRLIRTAYFSDWMRGMKEHNIKLIHAHYGPNGTRALPYKLLLGIPLVTSFYGFDIGMLEKRDVEENRRKYPVYTKYPGLLWEFSGLCLALSGLMRDDLIRVGCPPEKIRIQPNGIDLERFSPIERRGRPGPLTIAMCGWEVEKKGFTYGFQALKKALDRGADLRLRWLGVHGPLRPALLQEIQDLGLSERVEVMDEREDPKQLFDSADLVLCPSITDERGNKEGVPTVLVEGSASGLPSIASRHAGIPEIVVEGESGFLYPERDVDGLADGLCKLASDEALRLRMGERARAKAEESYNARTLALRLESYYQDLIKGS